MDTALHTPPTNGTQARLDHLDKRVDHIEESVDSVHSRVSNMRGEFDRLVGQLIMLKWLIGAGFIWFVVEAIAERLSG